jgi:regulator of PEP synthase PpsR (kinase-PPPase family)
MNGNEKEFTLTRTVFFISDGTGITAETLGRSLLSQFDMISFEYQTIPYVNTKVKVKQTIARIEQAYKNDGERPIIFATLINNNISELLQTSSALVMDFFQQFINPLENELGHKSTHMVGLSHGVKNYTDYMMRINAVNYALAYDDGANTTNYDKADIILVGVSRCGKTPTCLYLALQFGIYAANYPLTADDMISTELPACLANHRKKLFGLSIDANRLQIIRQERRPNSAYASLKTCKDELKYAENLFHHEKISYLETTSRSIEEIAAEIMILTNIKRRLSV